MHATYMRRMRNNNLEIRITDDSLVYTVTKYVVTT